MNRTSRRDADRSRHAALLGLGNVPDQWWAECPSSTPPDQLVRLLRSLDRKGGGGGAPPEDPTGPRDRAAALARLAGVLPESPRSSLFRDQVGRWVFYLEDEPDPASLPQDQNLVPIRKR